MRQKMPSHKFTTHRLGLTIYRNTKHPNKKNQFNFRNSRKDIQIIKSALEGYRLIWRRKISDMRCAIHRMSLGIRGFGTDLFTQGGGNQTKVVFLQDCCRESINEFLKD
jgi:hypothetical protein